MSDNQPIVFSYCDYIENLQDGEVKELNKKYHDTQYGFPIHNDNELFGRLILEINQAGLSWITMLKKQENFRKAFDNFDIQKIATYSEKDVERLLQDSGIIRNKLKINAVIYNAKVVLELQKQYGSFENWLDANHPLSKQEWAKLFKKHFKFVGGEIVGEFLLSTGYLKGAHKEDCPIFAKILETNPKWKDWQRSIFQMKFFNNDKDDFISTKCPHCSGELQFDETKENATCQYCGSKFVVNKNKYGKSNLDKILDFSEKQLDFVKKYMTKKQEQKDIIVNKVSKTGKKVLIAFAIIVAIVFVTVVTLIVLDKVGVF